jgi:hypothetical protein
VSMASLSDRSQGETSWSVAVCQMKVFELVKGVVFYNSNLDRLSRKIAIVAAIKLCTTARSIHLGEHDASEIALVQACICKCACSTSRYHVIDNNVPISASHCMIGCPLDDSSGVRHGCTSRLGTRAPPRHMETV